MSALKGFTPGVTPQSEPMPGKNQVKNEAGGYVFEVDKWTRLHRFLVLGTDGGSYYVGENELTRENALCVLDCIKEDGPRAVSIIVEISDGGRAPKNDQAIFALALATVEGDDKTRAAAYAAVPKVCRIGTHLFQLVEFREQFGAGWGSGFQKAIGAWYTDKEPDQLAYQAVKYQQRNGWSHRDLLRLSKPKGDDASAETNAVLRWIVGKSGWEDGVRPQIIDAFEEGKEENITEGKVLSLITQFGLPREGVMTKWMKSPKVWDALLRAGNGMPITALIRNLANMTRNGLLQPGSDATRFVVSRLSNQEIVHKGRVHPVTMLNALKVYAYGHSIDGRGAPWSPVPEILDALDEGFYLAFDNVEPTGKKHLLAVDISGSMGQACSGAKMITCREAAAVMAMVTLKAGDPCEVVGFSSDGYYGYVGGAGRGHMADHQVFPGLTPLALSKRQRLDDVVSKLNEYPYGGTDASLPIMYAAQAQKAVDIFVCYTDNETWAGQIHPTEALRRYRKESGIESKLACVSLVSNRVSIADPADPGTLDLVGFDTAAPAILEGFARGEF